MNIKQKIEERREIQPLLEYLQISAECIVDDEKPDFNLTYKGIKVGLEHVSICPSRKYNDINSSLSIINRQKRKAAVKAYEKILASRNENILMDVTFKNNAFWNKEKQYKFIEHVINEIEKLRNSDQNGFQNGNVISYIEQINTEYVESVQLILDNLQNPKVLAPSIQYVNKITQEDFDSCISGKYEKLTQYKQLEENAAIQEYWLVVTININEPYEFWNAPYEVSEANGYNRIFLIQYGRKVTELKI